MAVPVKKAEKITVTIPHELKEQLYALKKELHTSMSAIYKDALKAYIEQKERERWRRAAELMEREYENNPELTDWVEFEEDFYDHKTV
jgi:post-segregation antitoxin (ccd killing protein)